MGNEKASIHKELPSPPEKCNLSQSSSKSFFLVHCLLASQLGKKNDADDQQHQHPHHHTPDSEMEIKKRNKIQSKDHEQKSEYILEIYSDTKKNPIVMINDHLPEFKISISELASNESNIFVVYSRNSNGKSRETLLTSNLHSILANEANLTGKKIINFFFLIDHHHFPTIDYCLNHDERDFF